MLLNFKWEVESYTTTIDKSHLVCNFKSPQKIKAILWQLVSKSYLCNMVSNSNEQLVNISFQQHCGNWESHSTIKNLDSNINITMLNLDNITAIKLDRNINCTYDFKAIMFI